MKLHFKFSTLTLLITALLLWRAEAQTDGTKDPTFIAEGMGANDALSACVTQSDGKILIGGNFTRYHGIARNRIARLNTDGSLDTGFDPGTGANGEVFAIAVQSDGKILIGGDFTSYNGTGRNYVARLNTDGTLDMSFDPGTGANDQVTHIAVQSDGKILIGGVFTDYNGTGRTRIARLNTDGSLDTGFDPGTGANNSVLALSVQSDGKILIGGVFTDYNGTGRTRIARLNTDGSLDMSFNPGTGANSSVLALSIQSDGKILIGGMFTDYNGTGRNHVARLNTDGSLDTGFDPGTGANNDVLAIAVQSDGKILIGGVFTDYNGTARNRIARLNTDGSLDTGFDPGTGADSDVLALSIQSDGKILIGGMFTDYNGTGRNYVARLNTDGSLDTGFDPGTGANNQVTHIAVQSDGKILIGGGFTSYNGTARNYVARLNTDGSLDTGFDPGTGANNDVLAIAVQSDGKILIGGLFTDYNGTSRNRIARLNTDGSLDTGFDPGTGANNDVLAIAVQSDGKILIGGLFTDYNGTSRNRIARLNTDGSLDTGFDPGTGANNQVTHIAVQSDGKILIGGGFTSYNGTGRNRIARLNTDGSLDTGFDPGTGADSDVPAIAVQSDGKILIGGWFTDYNGTGRNYVARLNTDGSLDTGFDPGTGANGGVFALSVQSDGKILIGGWFTDYNGTGRIRIARLNTNGSLDTGFDPGTGANNDVLALSVQSDGKILIGGLFTIYNDLGAAFVTRILNSSCSINADAPVSGNATCRGGNGSIQINNPTGAASYEFTINAPSSSSTTGATWASATSYTPAAGTYHVWMRDVPTTCEKFLGTVTITEPAALSFTLFNQTNNACHGGTAGALTLNNPTGGNASATYTYAWSNGGTTQAISGLAAGTYTVTVSAVGCPGVELTADYTITEAPAMSALTVASQTNITCVGVNDGAVSITTPTGGSIPAGYAYSWSNGATTQGISGLSAGIYTVTVTAGMSGTCVNVTRTLEVTITTPAVMSDPVITSQTNITCHGATNGQATIGTPTGGATSPSYTYDWPSGADTQTRTDLSAGTYTVTVTACMGGTPKTVTVNITEPVQHNATVQHTPESCGGAADGTITISGSVGALDDIYEYSINSTNGTDGTWFGESTSNGRVFTGLTGSPMPGTTYRVWQRSATHPTCFFELSSVTMVAPPALTANITGFVEPPCSAPFTGSINIDVSGGNFTSQYTYQWTGPSGFSATTQNVTGITIGTYTVTITAVGCVPPLTRTLSQVINFAAIPTVNPSTIAVVSTSTNSASISWGAVMGATNYTFRFRPVGANTWTSVINTTNTFMNLTSLQAGTTYEFQVAVSGGGSSCVSNFEPTTPRTFTTTTASGGGSTSCITPTDFVVNNVTTTTAEASWSTNAAKCYLIQYGLATQTQSTWPEVFIAHSASILTLTGLQPGRSYRARIRANCTTCSNPSSFGTRTAYSALVSFNTPATREALSGLRESVSVYPNPSQGSFNVKFASEAGTVVTLRLLDLKGTVVYESTHSATDGENILPVVIEHYTRGIYALQIQRGTQVTTTRVSLD